MAFGDSWPEGTHCGGCTTFAGMWAADLEAQTGQEVEFTDFTGDAEPSVADGRMTASLLDALRESDPARTAAATADIILIATGPNEMEQMHKAVQAGTCGGPDLFDCIRALGALWETKLDAILTEIETLREGKPTVIRLVSAANPFVSYPEMTVGLPEGFATNGGALVFSLSPRRCVMSPTHITLCASTCARSSTDPPCWRLSMRIRWSHIGRSPTR